MAKSLGKYFIAIVPEGEVQENATSLKLVLKESYGIRYGLRSPAHVTLKMPFLWNEKKESELSGKLKRFFEGKLPFEIQFRGVDTFGKRVIFMKVKKNAALQMLQEEVIIYCKTTLKLDIELSDRVYTPHMTIAFKDLKDTHFSAYVDRAKEMSINARYLVNQVAMLKKDGGKWSVCGTFALGFPSVVNQN